MTPTPNRSRSARTGGFRGGIFAMLLALPTTLPASAASLLPPQVRLNVPFAPTAFPADGAEHLLYELYVTNFEPRTLTIERVEALDAARPDAAPLARFAGRPLDDIVKMAGDDGMDMSTQPRPVRVAAGATAVLFMAVTLPAGETVPTRLLQRVVLADGCVQGAPVGTRHTMLNVLAPPVGGSHWLAADGPGNGRYNHHRRGILAIGGTMQDARRFATDWKQVVHGAPFHGDRHADRAYYAYGKPVRAVADATVVAVRDGLPDNPPGHGRDFHPARPLTFDTLAGNTVVLDLGDGEYAHYDHLQPHSIGVRRGQRVRRGQAIARIGASGDAREPHLHFSVTTAIAPLQGEGLPYLIDRFRVTGGDGHAPGPRTRQSPLDGMLIDFGTDPGD